MALVDWTGGSGDWFDPENWNTGTVPAVGDVAVLLSGTAAITAADVINYGTDGVFEGVQVVLQNGDSISPTTFSLEDGTLGGTFNVTAKGGGQNGPATDIGQGSTQVFDALGTTEVEGQIFVTGINDLLTINVQQDGTGTPGDLTLDTHASINVSGDTALDLASGTVTNEGMILVDGVGTIGADVLVNGTGDLAMQQGGSIIVDGTIAGGQTVTMLDGAATLKLADLGDFAGQVELTLGGAIIDIDNLVANAASYHAGTLTLLDGGSAVGGIAINDPDGGGTEDFNIRQVGTGAGAYTEITYDPVHPATIINMLPVPIVADVGTQVSLSDVLTQAFGTIPSEYGTFDLQWKDVAQIEAENFSFWNPGSPVPSMFLQAGTATPSGPPGTDVPLSALGSITVEGGNAIGPFTVLTVPVGTGASPSSQLEEYAASTLATDVLAPTPPDGAPTPQDIVNAVIRFVAAYGSGIVPNDNDCGYIAAAVAASAGAAFPWETNLSNAVGGGFWRVVYNGATATDPVENWSTLTQPGDIVKMAWSGTGGHHTTTVVGPLINGELPVYDNVDTPLQNGDGTSSTTIGIHNAQYWHGTDPLSVVIFRLDPKGQYLINGQGADQFIQGSVYNNLIEPGGTGDVITAGAGTNEVQGATAVLQGMTITDFNATDSIDYTDLDPANTIARFDSTNSAIDVIHAGTTVSVVQVGTSFTGGNFVVGTDGASGALVSVACFAAGTRITTVDGLVAVEDLQVGDRVRTPLGGIAQPVVWTGALMVACAQHPDPRRVWPVRIMAGAFGRGRPRRDLFLSPDHAVYVEGVLIPVKLLINFRTVVQVPTDIISYYHLELPRHDVVLAEGLPTETYLAVGDRSDFADGGIALQRHPARVAAIWEAYGCAPLVVSGVELDAARCMLASIAEGPRRATYAADRHRLIA